MKDTREVRRHHRLPFGKRELLIVPSPGPQPNALSSSCSVACCWRHGRRCSRNGTSAVGLAWHWVGTGHLGLDYTIAGMNLFEFVLKGVHQVAPGAARPRLLVSLGMAVRMLALYVRALVSILYFAFSERNWKYALFMRVQCVDL